MCGRFTLTQDVREFAGALAPPAPDIPHYNICPSQPVSVILNNNRLQITKLKWGLIPAWAKEAAIGNKLANARAESLAEKPSFRVPLRRKRCLVLADGFYEWQQTTPKIPYYFRLKSRAVFAFAGLWDVWRDSTATCCLITTAPNALLARIHDRMPVILQPRHYDSWLAEAEQPPAKLLPLLTPYPAEEMEGFPVATVVNKPQHDAPDCIQPVGPPLTP
jgi:putative SOS response-associated peptidase YedK